MNRITYRPWPQPTADDIAIGKFTDVIAMNHPGNTSDAAKYYQKHLTKVHQAKGDYRLTKFVLDNAIQPELKRTGLYLEFGVFSGISINAISRILHDKAIHGFDLFDQDISFANDEDWNGHDFRQQHLPVVNSNVALYKGLFSDTMPDFNEAHKEPVAYIHLDPDNYIGCKSALDLSNIVSGTVIDMDEYINVPGWQNNEFKAFQDWIRENQADYKYIGVAPKHQQVAVKIL